MNGQMNGVGEIVPGHKVLEGTDLEIAYNLQGENLDLRVNKAGVQVFRVCVREAVPELLGSRLLEFNSMAPDLMFTVGDSEEGLNRMLRAADLLTETQAARAKGWFHELALGSGVRWRSCKRHSWLRRLMSTSRAWTSCSRHCASASRSVCGRCAKPKGPHFASA